MNYLISAAQIHGSCRWVTWSPMINLIIQVHLSLYFRKDISSFWTLTLSWFKTESVELSFSKFFSEKRTVICTTRLLLTSHWSLRNSVSLGGLWQIPKEEIWSVFLALSNCQRFLGITQVLLLSNIVAIGN